ncbi:MAG: hypothetical protein ACYS8Z_22675, partial [Planctomycetota bacterium]
MKRRNIIGSGSFVFLCALLGASGVAFGNAVCGNYYIAALPNYSGDGGIPGALAGGYPKAEGYDVVWNGWVGPLPPAVGGRCEVFRFDGTNTIQVTSNPNPLGNRQALISPLNRIVYVG